MKPHAPSILFLWFLLVTLCPFQAPAYNEPIPPLTVTPNMPFTSLDGHVGVNIGLGPQARAFEAGSADYQLLQKTLNLGYTTDTIWLKALLNNPTDQAIPLYLEVGFPQLDRVELYLPGKPDPVILGDTLPYDDRTLHLRTMTEPFSLDPGSHAVLVRVNTTSSTSVPLAISSPNAYVQRVHWVELYLGLFFGIVIALFIYNLMLFFNTREASFGYLAGFSFFGGLHAAILDGHGIAMWRDFIYWHNHAVAINGGLTLVMMIQFGRHFLNLKLLSPKLEQLNKILFWLCLIFAVLGYFMSQRFAGRSLSVLIMLVISVETIGGILSLRAGHKPAALFLASWACLFFIGFLASLASIGALGGFEVFSPYGIKISLAIMLLLLSLAQGFRINELKQARAVTHRELVEAEARSEAKSDFMARMSHELRTPMNAVLGITELMRDTPLSQKQTEYLDVVDKAGHSLVSVINDVLDFARLESGKVTLKMSNFNLADLLEECFSIIELGRASGDVTMSLDLDPTLPPLLIGDAARIRQIVLNLLGNAVKFTPKGGVLMAAQMIKKDKDAVLVKISVRDTGIGISPEMAERLFEPFIQADEQTTRRFGGTGLGLAISKQLVSIMGGEIGVASNQDKGSTFWFTIKAPISSRKTPAVKTSDQSKPLPDLHELRVLVAEDNPVNRMVVKGFLKRLKISAEYAVDGEEAMTLALRDDRCWDLVLMDCEMPIMDGYEATRRIREAETGNGLDRTTIIALTAHTLPDQVKRCMEVGMDDHLPKPLKFEDLHQCLIKHTEQKEAGLVDGEPREKEADV